MFEKTSCNFSALCADNLTDSELHSGILKRTLYALLIYPIHVATYMPQSYHHGLNRPYYISTRIQINFLITHIQGAGKAVGEATVYGLDMLSIYFF
jgi:hypothetical protein